MATMFLTNTDYHQQAPLKQVYNIRPATLSWLTANCHLGHLTVMCLSKVLQQGKGAPGENETQLFQIRAHIT